MSNRNNFTYNIQNGFSTAAEMYKNLNGSSCNESTDIPNKHFDNFAQKAVYIKQEPKDDCNKQDLSDRLFLRTITGSPKKTKQISSNQPSEMESTVTKLPLTNKTFDESSSDKTFNVKTKQNTPKCITNPYLKPVAKKQKIIHNPLKSFETKTSPIAFSKNNKDSSIQTLTITTKPIETNTTFDSIKQNTAKPLKDSNQNKIPLNTGNIDFTKDTPLTTPTTNNNQPKNDCQDKNSPTNLLTCNTNNTSLTEYHKKATFIYTNNDELASSNSGQPITTKNIRQVDTNEDINNKNQTSPPPGIIITGKPPAYDTRYTCTEKTSDTDKFLHNQLSHHKITNPETNLLNPNESNNNFDDDTEIVNLNTTTYENLLLHESNLLHLNDNTLENYSDDLSHEFQIVTPNLKRTTLHSTSDSSNTFSNQITPTTLFNPIELNESSNHHHSKRQNNDLSKLPSFKYIKSRFSRLSITEHQYKSIQPAFLSQPTAFILLSVE